MRFLTACGRHSLRGILFSVIGLLSACGQSGALYLPEPDKPRQQQAEPTDNSQQEKDSRQPED